jgi:hypothetical protein
VTPTPATPTATAVTPTPTAVTPTPTIPTATPTATPSPTPTPEPGVMLQLVSGIAGLAWLNKRRNRRRVGPRRATAREKKVQRR